MINKKLIPLLFQSYVILREGRRARKTDKKRVCSPLDPLWFTKEKMQKRLPIALVTWRETVRKAQGVLELLQRIGRFYAVFPKEEEQYFRYDQWESALVAPSHEILSFIDVPLPEISPEIVEQIAIADRKKPDIAATIPLEVKQFLAFENKELLMIYVAEARKLQKIFVQFAAYLDSIYMSRFSLFGNRKEHVQKCKEFFLTIKEPLYKIKSMYNIFKKIRIVGNVYEAYCGHAHYTHLENLRIRSPKESFSSVFSEQEKKSYVPDDDLSHWNRYHKALREAQGKPPHKPYGQGFRYLDAQGEERFAYIPTHKENVLHGDVSASLIQGFETGGPCYRFDLPCHYMGFSLKEQIAEINQKTFLKLNPHVDKKTFLGKNKENRHTIPGIERTNYEIQPNYKQFKDDYYEPWTWSFALEIPEEMLMLGHCKMYTDNYGAVHIPTPKEMVEDYGYSMQDAVSKMVAFFFFRPHKNEDLAVFDKAPFNRFNNFYKREMRSYAEWKEKDKKVWQQTKEKQAMVDNHHDLLRRYGSMKQDFACAGMKAAECEEGIISTRERNQSLPKGEEGLGAGVISDRSLGTMLGGFVPDEVPDHILKAVRNPQESPVIEVLEGEDEPPRDSVTGTDDRPD